MSAFSNYAQQSKQTRRFIWIGYLLSQVYIWLLHGFDDLIENITPTDNPFVLLLVAFGAYWLIVFLILWATDN